MFYFVPFVLEAACLFRMSLDFAGIVYSISSFLKLHREPLPWCKSVRHKSEYPFTNWQKGPFNIGTSITGCYVINIDT